MQFWQGCKYLAGKIEEKQERSASVIASRGLRLSGRGGEVQFLKEQIRYHRAMRILPRRGYLPFLEFVCLALPVCLGSFYFYIPLSEFLCAAALFVLEPLCEVGELYLLEDLFIWGREPLRYVGANGEFPNSSFLSANLLGCFFVLLVFYWIKKAKPLFIFFSFMAAVHLTACLVFLLLPGTFPYDVSDYSYLYVCQQIGTWAAVAVLMGMAVVPLPGAWYGKAVVIVAVYGYSLLFGILRYILFLYILVKLSLLYMPILFFSLGPLVDFFYMVGIYSIYITHVSKKIAGDYLLWK